MVKSSVIMRHIRMRRLAVILFILTLLSIIHTYPIRGQEVGKVLSIKVKGIITEGVFDYIESSIKFALDNKFDGLLIILNTDGGFLSPTEKIITDISSSPVPVAIYIPSGGRAFSAGSLISLAADKVCMGPGSSIGASEPKPKDEKAINALSSWMKSLAEASGKNSTAAELFVRRNLALTSKEAVGYNIADCIAGNSRRALEKIDWPTNVQEFYPDIRVSLLLLITDPLNAWAIFIIGAILLLLGLTHPTYILEATGAILVILGLYAFGMIGASLASVIFMIIGATTIFLELKTGHGLLALTGAIISAFGLFLLYQSGPLISLTLNAKVTIASFIIIAGLAGFYLYKVREILSKKLSPLSPEALIDRKGIVKVSIEPGKEGIVLVGSELWTAYSDEPLRVGDRVKVMEVRGFKVKVMRVH